MRSLSIFRLLVLALLIGGCNRAKDDIVPPAPPPLQLAWTGPQGVRFTLVNDLVTIVEFGEVAAHFGVDGEQNPPPATSTHLYLAGLYDGPLDEPIFTMTIGTLRYDERGGRRCVP